MLVRRSVRTNGSLLVKSDKGNDDVGTSFMVVEIGFVTTIKTKGTKDRTKGG